MFCLLRRAFSIPYAMNIGIIALRLKDFCGWTTIECLKMSQDGTETPHNAGFVVAGLQVVDGG